MTFPAELEIYDGGSGREREEWLRSFWKKRDMPPVSAAKARGDGAISGGAIWQDDIWEELFP